MAALLNALTNFLALLFNKHEILANICLSASVPFWALSSVHNNYSYQICLKAMALTRHELRSPPQMEIYFRAS